MLDKKFRISLTKMEWLQKRLQHSHAEYIYGYNFIHLLLIIKHYCIPFYQFKIPLHHHHNSINILTHTSASAPLAKCTVMIH